MNETFRREIYLLHSQLCQALSDPKRILILYALKGVERSVSDLSVRLGLRQANLSQHLSVLRMRSLVTARRRGPQIFYSMPYPKVLDALNLLREVLSEKRQGHRRPHPKDVRTSGGIKGKKNRNERIPQQQRSAG